VPATVHAKLLVAFLAMVLLLIAVGAVGLQVLSGANQRAEELIQFQRKIAAYRQLQHDATAQLHTVASALLVSEERTLDAALRQLTQFGYDLDRLQHVAKGEVELLAEVQVEYQRLIEIVGRVVQLIRLGKTAEGRELHLSQASPLAERLERLMNQLVNRAEADIIESVDATHRAYLASRIMVVGFAAGSILLAMLLGFAISWSLIGPVKRMQARFGEIAAGDFSRHVNVANRDELGAMGANLNRMNDELRMLYKQLETASRHKSSFLANMSHELRTPLNAILGYTELIMDGIYGQVPDRIKEVLRRVQHSGRHLLGLINDVLDLSKIEAGQLELSIRDFSIEDIARTVCASVESLAAEKKLALTISVPPGLPPVKGDERRIAQVLLNLVGNAIKFTDAGEIEVEAAVSTRELVISVADKGPGISVADRERIFDEFQQGDDAQARAKGGTGLGLAIAKRIVEMHGGRVWVDSSEGRGSIFRFTLPIPDDRTEAGA
jgi:signal transduction histidine kinase